MEKCKQRNTTTCLPPLESCTSLQRTWGPRQRNISPEALQQVVVERAKMPSHVDSAECTTTKSKKSATITSSLYEARAGTTLTTDYKSVVRLHHLEKPANKLNLCCQVTSVVYGSRGATVTTPRCRVSWVRLVSLGVTLLSGQDLVECPLSGLTLTLFSGRRQYSCHYFIFSLYMDHIPSRQLNNNIHVYTNSVVDGVVMPLTRVDEGLLTGSTQSTSG